MNIHPIANLFPLLSSDELHGLAEDIKQNGLQQAIIVQGDTLLDGRNRLTACELVHVEPRYEEYVGNNPQAFIISANIHRRHLTESQRAMIAAQLADIPVGRNWDSYSANLPNNITQPEAAKLLNVSERSLRDAKTIIEKSPELSEQITRGEITVHAARKELKAEADVAEFEAAHKTITEEKLKSLESVCDLRICSCAELFASGIKPDAVITDPPYPAEFLPVFTELAESCSAAGVPLVAVMSGQSYLPEVMKRLCEHLTYRWTLAYMTPGSACRLWQQNIDTTWKPVLLFGGNEYIFDVFRSDKDDKRFHNWGQSESGMADLIERLTKPGQLICDPFLGGGTTAVVSLELGRRFIGCDIDADCVATTRQRVEVGLCLK